MVPRLPTVTCSPHGIDLDPSEQKIRRKSRMNNQNLAENIYPFSVRRLIYFGSVDNVL